MSRPLVVDLCCRKGGATVGYQRAGFDVIGVDVEDQPGYPGDGFILGDALKVLEYGVPFTPVLWHGGPPCQESNPQNQGTNRGRPWQREHPQIIPELRTLLDATGIPYVIEQPVSRRGLIRRDLMLCMDMFKGDMPPPWVQHHRIFEIHGFTVPQPAHIPHRGYVRGHRHGVVRGGAEAPYVAAYGNGGGKATVAEMRHAKRIDWMTDHFDLREAIPPDYTEHIGRAFLDAAPPREDTQ